MQFLAQSPSHPVVSLRRELLLLRDDTGYLRRILYILELSSQLARSCPMEACFHFHIVVCFSLWLFNRCVRPQRNLEQCAGIPSRTRPRVHPIRCQNVHHDQAVLVFSLGSSCVFKNRVGAAAKTFTYTYHEKDELKSSTSPTIKIILRPRSHDKTFPGVGREGGLPPIPPCSGSHDPSGAPYKKAPVQNSIHSRSALSSIIRELLVSHAGDNQIQSRPLSTHTRQTNDVVPMTSYQN